MSKPKEIKILKKYIPGAVEDSMEKRNSVMSTEFSKELALIRATRDQARLINEARWLSHHEYLRRDKDIDSEHDYAVKQAVDKFKFGGNREHANFDGR